MPVIGVVADAVLDQFDSSLRQARALWRLGREKGTAKFVSRNQMRIEMGSDVQQRLQQFIASAAGVMHAAVVLHRTRPIDVRHKPVISEAQALQKLGRGNVEDFLQRSPGAELIHLPHQ